MERGYHAREGRRAPAVARAGRAALALAALLAGGCSSLLPQGESVTEGPWPSFEEAQQAFDKIVPRRTTVEELKQLKLDPASNPNITILNYSDVIRRFVPSPSVNAQELDDAVRECIAAKTACQGYEIEQKTLKRQRSGSFWADFLNFNRKVDVVGWRFNGLVLIKGGVVIYKLTGGQPAIREHEESRNPLGPLQSLGDVKTLER